MADKTVVRTEAAPAPFQGAPYSQAIAANGLRVRLRPARAEAGRQGAIAAARSRSRPSRCSRTSRAILEEAGTSLDRLVKTTVFLQNLDDFQGMNAVYAQHVGDDAAGALDRRGGEAAVRARSSRSRRSPSREALESYVRSLGLDAYLVGGAVRDELLGLDSKDADFLVPGVDTDGLKRALAPHGRVEDLDRRADGSSACGCIRATRPCAGSHRAGIEFAPPRKEVSTGPGRHDFEIVADASLSVEDDMRRRDFTVNAMARRLSTGEIVDPLGGEVGPRAPGPPHACRRRASRKIRSGSSARSASSPSSASSSTRNARSRCASEAPAVRLVSGERIGGGLAADGLGELSKLLLGSEPGDGAPARARHRRARRAPAGVRAARSASTRRAATTRSRSTSTRSRSCRRRRTPAARFAVRLAARLPRPRQAARRLARHRRAAALLREARLLRARATSRSAPSSPATALAAAALSERAARPRRAHRAPPHVPGRQGRRRCARAASSRSTATSSRSSSSTTRKPTTAASPGRTASRRSTTSRSSIDSAGCSSGSAGTRTGSPTSPSTATT